MGAPVAPWFVMQGRSARRFGPYRLDADDARLWKGSETVALTPKAFGVLQHLVSHAGRLVTKQELLEALWPGVFVGDAALKVCVREVRRALGDEPGRRAGTGPHERRRGRTVGASLDPGPDARAPSS
jgi:DNA-binding winged helix-turn-helix (wHTH) protein